MVIEEAQLFLPESLNFSPPKGVFGLQGSVFNGKMLDLGTGEKGAGILTLLYLLCNFKQLTFLIESL